MTLKEVFKKPVFWLTVSIIAIPCTYYFLGGFNPLQIKTVTVDSYYMIGKYFNGSYKSDTIQVYFSEMRDYVKTGTYQGPITIIYDQEPVGSRGMIKSFIGIRLSQATEVLPQDLTTRVIYADHAVRISKDCHSALMPNPNKIAEIINELLINENRIPFDFSIEMYYPNNRLVIEQPLKPIN